MHSLPFLKCELAYTMEKKISITNLLGYQHTGAHTHRHTDTHTQTHTHRVKKIFAYLEGFFNLLKGTNKMLNIFPYTLLLHIYW